MLFRDIIVDDIECDESILVFSINLPKLQEIIIGDRSFNQTTSLSISSFFYQILL